MHMLYIEKGLEKLFQVWSCWNLRRDFPRVEGLHVCDLHSRGCDPGGRPPAVFAVVGCFIQGICPVRSRVLLKVSFYFFLCSESNLEDSWFLKNIQGPRPYGRIWHGPDGLHPCRTSGNRALAAWAVPRKIFSKSLLLSWLLVVGCRFLMVVDGFCLVWWLLDLRTPVPQLVLYDNVLWFGPDARGWWEKLPGLMIWWATCFGDIWLMNTVSSHWGLYLNT